MEAIRTFLYEIFDAAFVFQFLLCSFGWVWLCRASGRRKKTRLRAGAEFLALYLLLSGCSMMGFAVQITFDGLPVQFINTAFQGLITFSYMQICSPYHRKANVVMWCSMYAGTTCLNMIAGQFSFLTGMYLAAGAMEGVVRSAVFALVPLLAFYLKRFNFDEYDSFPRSGFLLIVVGDVCILALAAIESIWSGRNVQIIICIAIAVLSLLLMVLVAIYAIYTMCQEQANVIALQAEKQRIISEREIASKTESNLETLRCIRHDLKNQYSYLQILLKEKRYEDMEQYFQEISENLPAQLNYVDCGNKNMNIILNMEMEKAQKAGIPVEKQLVVPPVLPFKEDDLRAIIVNMMDNAIEECIRLKSLGKAPEEAKDIRIRIEIYPQKDYLYLMCCNNTNLKKLQRQGMGIRTSRQDDKMHGYGTRIIAKMAAKYNGAAQYSLSDGDFVVKVLLDMMEGVKKDG